VKRLSVVVTAAVLAVGLLAACGTSENPNANPSGSQGDPVTVTDGRGKAVTLPAPATRVVALEWGEAEMLASLGVMPVGVADTSGYATWVTGAKLDSGVKDLGTRGEPSIDAIVALNPDLVVMEDEGMAAIVTQLEALVPVIVTKGSDAADNLGRMRFDFNLIAQAVGRTAEATRILSELDAALAAGKKKIADAGAAGMGFAMADGWEQGGAISIRMFGQGALVSQVAIQLGLTNVWTGPVDERWGLGVTDVEGLTAIRDANARFFYNGSDDTDVFADGLKANPIWQSLQFVQKGQLHKLPNGIWTFGGPASAQQYMDALVKAYTA
jgi:ABC-type Fe3+-hydroxamate transport system substrate-binding protein